MKWFVCCSRLFKAISEPDSFTEPPNYKFCHLKWNFPFLSPYTLLLKLYIPHWFWMGGRREMQFSFQIFRQVQESSLIWLRMSTISSYNENLLEERCSFLQYNSWDMLNQCKGSKVGQVCVKTTQMVKNGKRFSRPYHEYQFCLI